MATNASLRPTVAVSSLQARLVPRVKQLEARPFCMWVELAMMRPGGATTIRKKGKRIETEIIINDISHMIYRI